MKKYFLSFILLVVVALGAPLAQAQNLSTTSGKAAKLYKKGMGLLKQRAFEDALLLFVKATKADKNFFEAHMAAAEQFEFLGRAGVYRQQGFGEKAKKYYAQAAACAPNDRRALKPYSMMANQTFEQGKYEEAKNWYTKMLRFDPENPQLKRQIASCDFAQGAMKNPVPFTPEPLSENINFGPYQYFATLTADQEMMVFVHNTGATMAHDEDLYVSQKENGEWKKAEPLLEINQEAPFNEGTCAISADGNTMIFTKSKNAPSRPPYSTCDLYITRRVNGKWGKPQPLKSLNTPYFDSQPTLSADGRTLYFISDRPGGHGVDDIYVSYQNAQGNWSKPKNLGPKINTAGAEATPFIHPNGRTLYFASTGHLGMGSYDLFKAEHNGKMWQKPENLGYPLNDQRSQVALFVTADGKKAYYSVEEMKDGRKINSIIHQFDLPEKMQAQTRSNFVKGFVYDEKTKAKLKAEVALYNLATKEIESKVEADPKTGFLIVLNEGSQYALHVRREGYLFNSLAFDYSGEKVGRDVEKDVPLQPVEKDRTITLENIFFTSGSWELDEKSTTELEATAQFLKENPKLQVEISGHTDNVGKPADNLTLSTKRAEAVVRYLTKQGEISPERLKAKGYGETKPKTRNDTEEGRAQNRRIEFKVL